MQDAARQSIVRLLSFHYVESSARLLSVLEFKANSLQVLLCFVLFFSYVYNTYTAVIGLAIKHL